MPTFEKTVVPTARREKTIVKRIQKFPKARSSTVFKDKWNMAENYPKIYTP